MGQKSAILKALKNRQFITPDDAIKQFNCYRLGGRIYELRKEGHDIRDLNKGTGKHSKYYLIADGIRRCF